MASETLLSPRDVRRTEVRGHVACIHRRPAPPGQPDENHRHPPTDAKKSFHEDEIRHTRRRRDDAAISPPRQPPAQNSRCRPSPRFYLGLPVIGRLADFFRLAWGLLYWNFRKSWFRFRRGRAACPCQSPSDSGRAMETGCEACLHWAKPSRFRRVCPLLVETPDGLRCSANTADVRPFWGRVFAAYGGTALALYLLAAIAIFVFLRTVGYPISIVHLVWPGKWHRVGEVRGWYFFERSNRAFAAGRPAEGMLYLRNAYEFNPADLPVALTLAQKLQLANPGRSDAIYAQLLADRPESQAAIAQIWFRALLARGDFLGVERLAAREIVADPAHASVWLRAFLFANRQTGNFGPLNQLLEARAPEAALWRPLLLIEAELRAGHLANALAELKRPWPQAPAYGLFYQLWELIAHDEALLAVDLLGSYGHRLDDAARATLLLEAYARLDANRTRELQFEALLAPPLNAPTISVLAANLIRHPDPTLLNLLFTKFAREKPPVTEEHLESYLALFCACGAVGDATKIHLIAASLRRDSASGNVATLSVAERFFLGQVSQTRIAGLLSALPAPLEVHYALLERYPGQARTKPARASDAP